MTNLAVPRHVGFIVDGNRRWARQHQLPDYQGHVAGYKVLQDVVLATFQEGVEFVSAYVFSTENWQRSHDEVSRLMVLTIDLLTNKLSFFNKNGIKLRVIGTREKLSPILIKAIDDAEAKTANNTAGTLALCFNYGGQMEIVEAVKKIVESKISSSSITSAVIEQNLYAPEIPPIDMVVRTSGEQRLSNFMLWRTAYSEIMFIEKLWPDMTGADVVAIIEEYNKRSRRFGK
jgi:undecaprenyl diphosphate synthase